MILHKSSITLTDTQLSGLKGLSEEWGCSVLKVIYMIIDHYQIAELHCELEDAKNILSELRRRFRHAARFL